MFKGGKEGAESAPAAIRLPDDPELVAKLTRKCAEYEARMDEARRLEEAGKSETPESENKEADEAYQLSLADSIYKFAILKRLLNPEFKDEGVNHDAILSDLESVHHGIYREVFERAFQVIRNYTEGKENKGGTGLE